MDLNQQRVEIEQFLLDVREHIRSSLETSEYENTSNLFHVTEAQSSLKLLQKCEQLLARFADRHHNSVNKNCNGTTINGSDNHHRFNNNNQKQSSTIATTAPTTIIPLITGTARTTTGTARTTTRTTTGTTTMTTTTMSTMTTNKDMLTMTNGMSGSMNGQLEQNEDVSYLDMTASKKISNSKEYIAFNNSTHSDKTFRCSTRNGGDKRRSSLLRDGSTSGEDDDDDTDDNNDSSGDEHRNDSFDEEDEEEPQIYDICHVTQVDPDETQKPITAETHLDQTHQSQPIVDCPYMDLPAGHLAIQRSTKYGQLQRIEKRLFFDQSKKCYCGILNDWLLCYADGPTSSRPNITLHLKSPGIEIEHSGEGKRREVCFQITTPADASKRYVFQANNEVDAKEWIHAIEAAIRGDCAAVLKNSRKLPTPPVMKRMTFVSGGSGGGKSGEITNSNPDSIYEEPSPLYHVHEPTELLISSSSGGGDHKQHNGGGEKPPDLPEKQLSNNPIALAKQFEYDVPKCPPQPLVRVTSEPPTELETAGLLNHADEPHLLGTTTSMMPTTTMSSGGSPCRPSSRNSDTIADFQTKVKDVHSKLSSQLSAGPSLKKPVKKSYSSSSNEAESVALTTSPTTTKELKKQKKSNSPSPASQKTASIGRANGSSCSAASAEKSAKNWFLNRLNKTTSSTRSSSGGGGGGNGNSTIISPTRCKQSEKENLLSSLDFTDSFDGPDSNPTSPILKGAGVNGGSGGGGAKSKVNMIINQFESSGHLAMFSVEALAGNAAATFSSFCDNDCNNYEPIMTLSTPPSSFMKKV